LVLLEPLKKDKCIIEIYEIKRNVEPSTGIVREDENL
jgi:hypothetical protein